MFSAWTCLPSSVNPPENTCVAPSALLSPKSRTDDGPLPTVTDVTRKVTSLRSSVRSRTRSIRAIVRTSGIRTSVSPSLTKPSSRPLMGMPRLYSSG